MTHLGELDPPVPEAVWDAWAVTELVDGSTRPATKGELLQRGFVVMGRGAGVVHVLVTALDGTPDRARHAAMACPPGSSIVPVSARPGKRWQEMQRKRPDVWRRCALAEIARNSDGSSLRAELEREERGPGRGRRTLAPGRKHDAEAVTRARELVRDPAHPAARRRVSMAEIQDGDVVVEIDLPPVRIQGECRR